MRSAPSRAKSLFENEYSHGETNPQMSQLVATARRLRKTRAACQKFLALWALQNGTAPQPGQEKEQDIQLKDPMNHDWSLLYLGSILDD